MGGVSSINCECFSVISSACKGFNLYLHHKPGYEKLSILEEDDTNIAGLLTELDIQRLLNESVDMYSSSKDLESPSDLTLNGMDSINFDNSN